MGQPQIMPGNRTLNAGIVSTPGGDEYLWFRTLWIKTFVINTTYQK